MRLNLPPRPGLADAPRALELDHRRVAPREAVERHLQPEARAGAVAVGVLARQPPVDHEVIVELGVVGDVGEVLEDLLARTGDGDLDADGIHGAGVYPRRRSGGPSPNRVPALGVVDDLRALGRGRRGGAGTGRTAARRRRRGAPARRPAGCARSRRSSPARRPARRRSCAAARARDRLRRCRAGAATWGRRSPPAARLLPRAARRRTVDAGFLRSVSRVARIRSTSGPAGGKGPINKPNSAIGPIDTVVIIVTSRRPRPGRFCRRKRERRWSQ